GTLVGTAAVAAIAVRGRDRVVLGAHRLAGGLAILLARGHLERAEREAVVAVLEVRDVGLLRVLARGLERELVRLAAARREERLVHRLRRELHELLREPDGRQRAVLAGDLEDLAELLGRR